MCHGPRIHPKHNRNAVAAAYCNCSLIIGRMVGLFVILELVVDGDLPALHVDIRDGQSGEFTDPQTGMKEDVQRVIVHGIVRVCPDELQIRPLLRQGQGLPGAAVIGHGVRGPEVERVLADQVVVDSHPEGRPQDFHDRLNRTVVIIFELKARK